MIEYALHQSFVEMKLTLSKAKNNPNNEELKKEVNYRVGTFLHWLIDAYERIESSSAVAQFDKSFFSGLRYANNKLKHDLNIIKVYQQTGGFSFPISFPFSSPITEYKCCIYEDETNEKYKKQYKNYARYIQNTNIIEICEKAFSIIDELYTNQKGSPK